MKLTNSSRAKRGKLDVVEKFCPRCSHDRAFETYPIGGEGLGITKCTRCGYRYD